MNPEELNLLVESFAVDTSREPDKEKSATLLKLMAEALAFQKLKELGGVQPQAPKQENERVQGGLKFTRKELNLMPPKYRKIFACKDLVVGYRLKPCGVYEARYHRGGIHIEVSSKDLNVLKKKFIDKLNHYDDVSDAKNFNTCFEKWLAVKEKVVKPVTHKGYCSFYENYIKPFFAGKKLGDVNRETMQEFVFQLSNKGIGATCAATVAILKAFWDVMASDLGITSPMTKVEIPKYEKQKGSALSKEEEKVVIDYLLQNRSKPSAHAFVFLLYTGLRRSELASLRFVDDFWLECESAKQKRGAPVVKRRIPITPMLRRLLPYLDLELAKTNKAHTFSTVFKRLLPNHHLHELRYTFITRAKECGINPELVMLWDGHEFDKNVMSSKIDRHYTDYSDEYQLKEAQKYAYPL